MIGRLLLGGPFVVALFTACGPPSDSGDLIFVDGRAVTAVGDSVLAITRQGQSSIILRDRRTGAVYTRDSEALHSPHHVQERDGMWYVSDVDDEGAWIVIFDAQWEVVDRLSVDTLATAPHQFAVLPDGRIVVEGRNARLVAIDGDSLHTFALFDPATRTGLVVAALGGVIHAVPDRYITLYNANGNVRWRLPWKWHDEVFVSDLSVDAHGRIHMLASEGGARSRFVCFTLSPTTGEVVRWSEPGPAATFLATPLGEIVPDSVDHWLRR
ncbi:MAG: hypothetical protein OEO20_03290 [Gemmatimonadota bacterium]|nr:hypothetical protein [Gemmatimonadota bacterium]MDH3368011.1 hypothetical protein [Gemmatimonadota bacterium]MDH3477308.1 hypothetical protein [Gemmatimonadota bacterium]MDH5550663.1 hypothetical protein [Gemmatimonadota bacterium]